MPPPGASLEPALTGAEGKKTLTMFPCRRYEGRGGSSPTDRFQAKA